VLENETPYKAETAGVAIAVIPQYMESDSDPALARYCHAYTIRIENRGPETVQLLRRHWLVESDGALVTEVKGEGVVGEQPVLRPGEIFTYTSGTVISDPIGAMHGTYAFQSPAGDEFDVVIPRFDLVAPSILQ